MESTTWLDAGPVDTDTGDASTQRTGAIEHRRRLLERLASEGWRYDFFQAVRLLEKLYPDTEKNDRSDPDALGRVQLRPHDGLAFPATDVRRIEVDDEKGARVHVTFMGLYGISSPLPDYFSESVTAQQEGSSALRSLLDIFSHRIYTFFYRAWRKYRPETSVRRDRTDAHSRRFAALTGLGVSNRPDAVPAGLLEAFAGRLLPRARNAEGLRAMVSAACSLPATVIENVPRWVPITDRPRMGRSGGMALGRTATIGERLLDVMGKLRISLGPMDAGTYESLLPGGEKAEMLQALVRTYVAGYLDYDVELRLAPGALQATRLGEATSRLGYTACLGTPMGDLVRIVRYERPG